MYSDGTYGLTRSMLAEMVDPVDTARVRFDYRLRLNFDQREKAFAYYITWYVAGTVSSIFIVLETRTREHICDRLGPRSVVHSLDLPSNFPDYLVPANFSRNIHTFCLVPFALFCYLLRGYWE